MPERFPSYATTGILILLASCVAPPSEESQQNRLPTDAEVEQYNASVTPEERIVCRNERQIGTNILKRVCRYVVDVEETSIFHREELRRVLR